MEDRKEFTFRESWWKAIESLTRGIQGEVLTAVVRYGLYGETTENLKPIARAIVEIIISQIDDNLHSPRKGCPKGKVNNPDGRRGKRTNSELNNADSELKEELNKRKIEVKYLDGTTNAKERIKLVSKFNESKEAEIFLISLKAGGTGLNLTSAKFVMHMDPWWNPSIEDQATDRAHRIGQKNIVEVIKLIAKDTIEEKIIDLQEDKREIINSIMDDESLNINNISRLTNDEILNLFK